MVLGRVYKQRWASRVMNTKKTESRGCVGKKFFFTNFQSGTPSGDVVRKITCSEGKVGT